MPWACNGQPEPRLSCQYYLEYVAAGKKSCSGARVTGRFSEKFVKLLKILHIHPISTQWPHLAGA